MKALKKLLSVIVFFFMLFAFSKTSLAFVNDAVVNILPGGGWTADYDLTDSRSGQYGSVYARLESLQPVEGYGIYSKCKVQVTNSYDLVISDVYTLNKFALTQTTIQLINPQNVTRVGFEFAGNNANLGATAVVDVDGR